MNIRQNDIIELHADCREIHVPLRTLPGAAAAAAGLQAAGIGFERTAFHIRRQRQLRHHLVLGMAGEGRVLIDGTWQPLQPGQLWVCPAGQGEEYELGPSRRWEILWLTMQPGRGPWSEFLAGQRAGLRPARWGGQLQRIVQGIHRESFAEERGKTDLLGHLLSSLRLYLERELATPDDQPLGGHAQRTRLRALFDQVREDLAAEWSVEELLRRSELYVGIDHFTRLCRDLLGRTPMQMVCFLRMHHCAQLLRCTDYSLETIAGLVGYRTPFALSNAFAREFGQRPRDFRRG